MTWDGVEDATRTALLKTTAHLPAGDALFVIGLLASDQVFHWTDKVIKWLRL